MRACCKEIQDFGSKVIWVYVYACVCVFRWKDLENSNLSFLYSLKNTTISFADKVPLINPILFMTWPQPIFV